MPGSLLERVFHTIRLRRLIRPQDRVLVAVSGGADSVALLHLLLTIRERFDFAATWHVAHLDHALRKDAARDAAFVQSLAERWRVPATIERQDVGAICRERGWSLEDGARRVRYEFLRRVAQRQRLQRVALAHTADDQAETVLLRLMRGSGLAGLSAMPMERPLLGPGLSAEGREEREDPVTLIRPLLDVWRKELVGYLREAGLSHREDPTNRDCRFTRNRVRHQLLPLLERDYNPNVKQALTQLAKHSAADYAYLQEAAARQWRRAVKQGTAAGACAILLRPFLRQPSALQRQLARRVIASLKTEDGELAFRHWVEIERLATERPVGTVLDLPGGVRLLREADRIVCERK